MHVTVQVHNAEIVMLWNAAISDLLLLYNIDY